METPTDTELLDQLLHRPEIVVKNVLTGGDLKEGNFGHCAKMAQTLLNIAPSYLSHCMRMELTPAPHAPDEEKTWDLALKFSTVSWFDRHLTLVAKDKKLPIALSYLSCEREAISQTLDTYTEDEPIEVFQKEICRFGKKCRGGCRDSHPDIVCDVSVKRLGGSTRQCNWYYCRELGLLDPGSYILMVRPEPYRDLLLLPTPKNKRIRKALGHMTNVELASSEDFWKSCFQKIQELVTKSSLDVLDPIQKIALNFGTWESAMSKDKKAIDCHGHGHIELTHKAALMLSSDFTQLKGRTGSPEDYREQNCAELETGRLISFQFRDIHQKVDDLDTKVDALEKKLEKRMDNIDAKLDQVIAYMRASSSPST